jgi:choice-of-anchor A domain-containing protein
VDFNLLEAQVNNLSTNLAALASNGTVSGALTLTGTNATLNVFNITAAQLNTTQVNVNFPAGSSVVVNVSGTSVSWVNGSVCLNGQCSDSTQADYVLWNFYQATSVYMTGIAIEGSILAPLATLKGDGGHIAGQVIVQYLTGGLEYHPYYFAGCLKY